METAPNLNEDSAQRYILVVDDSPTQVELLRFLLEKVDYRVVTASDGKEALERVYEKKPALIISDIVMPVMNGYELCGTLKRDELYRDIPIILLTRLADVEDIIVGLEALADYYVTKPFREAFLLSRVSLLLDDKQRRINLEDADELQVTLAGKCYAVSAERRHMLEMLISTYENAIQKNHELIETQRELSIANERLSREARRAEEAQSNYLSVLSNSPDAMIVVDRERKMCFVNAAARELLLREEYELIGAEFPFDIQVDEMREVTVERTQGPNVVAELRIADITWAGQDACLASLRDISERKLSEEKIRRQNQKLHEINDQLQSLAMLDMMTGLYNFRAFTGMLQSEVQRAQRYKHPLSLLLLDIDRFKQYNDTFGHLAGDEVLNTVARLLRDYVRTCDFVARYGGEEFVVLLPDTNAVGAVNLAERLRVKLEKHNWELREVTASFGVATLDDSIKEENQFLAAADAAMYQSKYGGRNRVTHARDVEHNAERDRDMQDAAQSEDDYSSLL